MRRFAVALSAVVALGVGAAIAQTPSGYTAIQSLFTTAPAVSLPLVSGDSVGLVRGNIFYRVPGDSIAAKDGAGNWNLPGDVTAGNLTLSGDLSVFVVSASEVTATSVGEDARIAVDNQDGLHSSIYVLRRGGVSKWQMLSTVADTFSVYDITNNQSSLSVTAAGVTTLGETGSVGNAMVGDWSSQSFNGTLFYAPRYGSCTWDSTHDVGSCINLAIAAAVANGGGWVGCPAGDYGLSTMVRVQASNIGLRCGAQTGTKLIAIGGLTRMVSFDAPYGDTNKKRLFNNTIDLWTDGNGVAADGLYLASTFGLKLDFRASGAFSSGAVLSFDVVPAINGSTFGEAIDIQDSKVSYNIDVTGTSTPLYLGNYITGTGSHGNASFNEFFLSTITSDAATGILCYGCDGNIWHKGRVFDTNISVDLGFATSGAAFFPANGNKFLDGFQYTGSFQARGTPTKATCTPVTINPTAANCTYANWLERDQTNGSPAPTIEAGADLKSGSNEGFLSGLSFSGIAGVRPGLVATETGSTIQACLDNAFTYGSAASIYSCNTGGAGLIFFDSLGGDRFNLNWTGSAGARNLRLSAGAGTGKFEIAPTLQTDTGLVPSNDVVQSIGGTSNRYSIINTRDIQNNNGTNQWYMRLGAATSPADDDFSISHDGTPFLTINHTGGITTFGGTVATGTAGEVGLSKIADPASAPGAGSVKLTAVCGTNAGTAKIIVRAGTSATAVTLLDNVGAGVTGC